MFSFSSEISHLKRFFFAKRRRGSVSEDQNSVKFVKIASSGGGGLIMGEKSPVEPFYWILRIYNKFEGHTQSESERVNVNSLYRRKFSCYLHYFDAAPTSKVIFPFDIVLKAPLDSFRLKFSDHACRLLFHTRCRANYFKCKLEKCNFHSDRNKWHYISSAVVLYKLAGASNDIDIIIKSILNAKNTFFHREIITDEAGNESAIKCTTLISAMENKRAEKRF